MADGGRRAGFSIQVKTEVQSGLIVGLSAGNNASDRGQLGPAVAEIAGRYDRRPKQLLADSGYDSKTDIEAVSRPESGGVEVFCPLPCDKLGIPTGLSQRMVRARGRGTDG